MKDGAKDDANYQAGDPRYAENAETGFQKFNEQKDYAQKERYDDVPFHIGKQ